MAQQFGDKTIIPLAVNGYNLRSDYNNVYEEIVGQHLHGEDLMEVDGFQKLLSAINENL